MLCTIENSIPVDVIKLLWWAKVVSRFSRFCMYYSRPRLQVGAGQSNIIDSAFTSSAILWCSYNKHRTQVSWCPSKAKKSWRSFALMVIFIEYHRIWNCSNSEAIGNILLIMHSFQEACISPYITYTYHLWVETLKVFLSGKVWAGMKRWIELEIVVFL